MSDAPDSARSSVEENEIDIEGLGASSGEEEEEEEEEEGFFENFESEEEKRDREEDLRFKLKHTKVATD